MCVCVFVRARASTCTVRVYVYIYFSLPGGRYFLASRISSTLHRIHRVQLFLPEHRVFQFPKINAREPVPTNNAKISIAC